MSYVVVTIETEHRGKVDLAVPLDVPSRTLASQVMKQLGNTVRRGDAFAFFIKTDGGERRISSGATLADAGVTDRQLLLIRREAPGARTGPLAAPAHLRTAGGDILPLDADNVVVGRRDVDHEAMVEVDLSKYDPNYAVSRRHASIGRQGTDYYLIDLDSTNGTRLNGKDVPVRQKMQLHDGDTIEFGREGVRLTFVLGK